MHDGCLCVQKLGWELEQDPSKPAQEGEFWKTDGKKQNMGRILVPLKKVSMHHFYAELGTHVDSRFSGTKNRPIWHKFHLSKNHIFSGGLRFVHEIDRFEKSILCKQAHPFL